MTAHKVTTGPLKVLSAISILALSLMLGLAFDLLIRGRSPGLGVVAFFTLACVSVPAVRRPARPETWALLAAAWSMAAWTMIRDAGFLVGLDIVAALLLGSLAVSSEVFDLRVWVWRIRDHLGSWFDQALAVLAGASTALAELIGRRDHPRLDRVAPYLRGVALAIPVFLVFALLLAGADAVFSDFLGDAVPDWNLGLGATFEHLVWIALVAWAAAGLLTFVVQPLRPAGAQRTGGDDRGRRARQFAATRADSAAAPRDRHVEAMIVMSSVAALLALFVVFQFAYLFRGQAQIDLPGVTYAEYAREGFFQLLVVAALVVVVVWSGLSVSGEGQTPARRRALLTVATALIVLTGVILVSALKRLGLYEDAYGSTRPRLLARVAIFWVAAVLALLLAQIHWPRRHLFVAGVVLTAFAAWTSVNALDPDARIAAANLDRAGEVRAGDRAAAIDSQLAYLTDLSADAVPEVAGRIAAGTITPSADTRHLLEHWFCAETPRGEGVAEWNRGRRRAGDAIAALGWELPGRCGADDARR